MAATLPPELAQVLKGLALNRTPGWNFPGNFLELSFDEIGPDAARLSIEPGPHCLDGDGQMSLGAIGVLADIGMAAAMRHRVGMATRMATVAMSVQFTGAPRTGRLEARGRFDGFVQGAAGRQGLGRAEIHGDAGLVCTTTGTFMALGNRDVTAPLPMGRREDRSHVAPLAVDALNEEERAVYARAQSALAAKDEGSFIARFWGLLARRSEGGAVCEMANGLHVGNRVAHTQGGLTFALAAVTGQAALPDAWHLVGVSAWYVSPGKGALLRAEASVVHQGSLTGVVRTRIVDGDGRTVMEAMTNHARASAPAKG